MSILRNQLNQPDVLKIPGVYDALSALIAERAGLKSVFLSGSAVAFSRLGRPDIGLITMTEMADICACITDRINIPVIVDVDSGFGNSFHASRTIRVMERVGAAAIQMEDQLAIKPDSDVTSRPLISITEMVDKINAVMDARLSTDMLVSVRSDSPFTEPLDTTLERVAAYCEAGADMIFVEGLKTKAEMKSVINEAGNVPTLYNLMRHTGEITLIQDLQEIGVSGAFFPVGGILSAATALQVQFNSLEGRESHSDSEDNMTIAALKEIVGIH